LVLLDPENIPTAQEEIRRLQAELQEIEGELRKRPPTEAEVHTEALEVLNSLVGLGFYFRIAARHGEAGYPDPDTLDQWNDLSLFRNYSEFVRPFLRRISGITVHTRIVGYGNGIRHTFLRGEIAFSSVGVTTSNLNPHRPG